jgi:hypothetical protein
MFLRKIQPVVAALAIRYGRFKADDEYLVQELSMVSPEFRLPEPV